MILKLDFLIHQIRQNESSYSPPLANRRIINKNCKTNSSQTNFVSRMKSKWNFKYYFWENYGIIYNAIFHKSSDLPSNFKTLKYSIVTRSIFLSVQSLFIRIAIRCFTFHCWKG